VTVERRLLDDAVELLLEVQVRAGAVTGVADDAELRALVNSVADGNIAAIHVQVAGLPAAAVVHDHHLPTGRRVQRGADRAAGGGEDRRTAGVAVEIDHVDHPLTGVPAVTGGGPAQTTRDRHLEGRGGHGRRRYCDETCGDQDRQEGQTDELHDSSA